MRHTTRCLAAVVVCVGWMAWLSEAAEADPPTYTFPRPGAQIPTEMAGSVPVAHPFAGLHPSYQPPMGVHPAMMAHPGMMGHPYYGPQVPVGPAVQYMPPSYPYARFAEHRDDGDGDGDGDGTTGTDSDKARKAFDHGKRVDGGPQHSRHDHTSRSGPGMRFSAYRASQRKAMKEIAEAERKSDLDLSRAAHANKNDNKQENK